jgi:nicotinate-nucleotide adenylyltransferase
LGLTFPPQSRSKPGDSDSVSLKGQQRIGVFGGAFDPPHLAHVALAQLAIEQLALAKLHIVPTGHAWHKTRHLSAAADRLAMAKLAFAPIPQVVVDDRELHRAGPTYTIDTLQAIQAVYPAAELYLFMGADQFAAFSTWHRWQEVAKSAIICIAARARIYCAKDHFDALNYPDTRVIQLLLPDMPISATRIRDLAAAGQDITSLVTGPVARYISLHQLYRPIPSR